MSEYRAAIVILNDTSLPLAQTISRLIPNSEIHGLVKRIVDVDIQFEDTINHLQNLFTSNRPIIGICASGILIRAIAAVVSNKAKEPPVIAIGQDGSSVVPLLGGHHGANNLATKIANGIGGTLALTTASDTKFGIALDDPPSGYHLANPESLKPFVAKILAGENIKTEGDAPWLKTNQLPLDDTGSLSIIIDEHLRDAAPNQLIFHPETLALGVGCERGCSLEELQTLVRTTLIHYNLAAASIAAVVSIDLKCDEPAVEAIGAMLNRPVRYFDAKRLEKETPRLANPSNTVFHAVGCHGVSEGAALAAIGEHGKLIVQKQKSLRATCAITKSDHPLRPDIFGRGKGSLAVIGLGPGQNVWRTEEANALLTKATDLVGYSGYLDLLTGFPLQSKTLHPYNLGEETNRVEAALDLAAEGKKVALICSGDPGIYAMAALVFEHLDRGHKQDWKWVDITVVPGISALQAAAARLGAPLGHDFCAISLSDLMTPWSVIERRLNAAASGDFIIALYNPASQKRRDQLVRALKILAPERTADTPIVAAQHLGRPQEKISIHTFSTFDPNIVDMSTLVLIGSSETRKICGARDWVYTPRGYGAKSSAKKKTAS
ncbi:MAG: precorrin-3B C(17)-methyltransferase [Rhodospirillaceae bacterium]|nr:precorrin-3B C(17)-methyltransferase [Rhodospirillaceae bacterium]